ncbi:MAG: hypothetical protein FD163_946 [Hyphomonadaceae bacterium]|nr:MAG: hypothetical protein FD128_1658 [Hyphomonadaceae bacterium]KAF0186278.1 MAG: hypothetical protein FD163_946 [Hyphomonadaceae bacterium]
MTLSELLKKIIRGGAPFALLYVALIPFINWSYGAVPTLPMPDGGAWPPMSIVAGLVLVVRDFAQREIKHYIWVALAIAAALSFVTSPAVIAIASTVAFIISETIDWALFTFSKKPLSYRVMLSSLISAPIDTTAFWYLASLSQEGVFRPYTIATAIVSKLLGAYVVYLILKRREAAGEDTVGDL